MCLAVEPADYVRQQATDGCAATMLKGDDQR